MFPSSSRCRAARRSISSTVGSSAPSLPSKVASRLQSPITSTPPELGSFRDPIRSQARKVTCHAEIGLTHAGSTLPPSLRLHLVVLELLPEPRPFVFPG